MPYGRKKYSSNRKLPRRTTRKPKTYRKAGVSANRHRFTGKRNGIFKTINHSVGFHLKRAPKR